MPTSEVGLGAMSSEGPTQTLSPSSQQGTVPGASEESLMCPGWAQRDGGRGHREGDGAPGASGSKHPLGEGLMKETTLTISVV